MSSSASADEEPRAGERRLVLLVVADDVADVLAQEALDALAELLRPLDVDLLPSGTRRAARSGRRRERRDLAGLLVVERHVGDQVPDHREGPHRRDGDRLVLGERRHPGHAQQPRPAVDLGAARAALAGLAVPAHREVAGLGGLQPVDDVEDDLALVDLDGVVAAGRRRSSSPRHTRNLRVVRSSVRLLRRRRCGRRARLRSGTWPARRGRTGRAGPRGIAGSGCSLRRRTSSSPCSRADQVDLAPLRRSSPGSRRGCARRATPALQRRPGHALARPAACCAGRARGASRG